MLSTCPLLRNSGSQDYPQKNEVKQGQLLIGIWGWEEAMFINWTKRDFFNFVRNCPSGFMQKENHNSNMNVEEQLPYISHHRLKFHVT